MENDNKKKFYVNEYTGEVIDDEILKMKLEKLEIDVENDKQKRMDYFASKTWKYKYLRLDKDTKYTLKDFEVTGNLNNQNKLSNFEMYANNLPRLTIPKILIQAYGLQVALYWCEMARLSMYKPVNNYGYFTTSKYEINTDIGLSPKQQDKICKILQDLNVIETYTFKKEMRKFYKFNDNIAKDILTSLYLKTFRSVKFQKEFMNYD